MTELPPGASPVDAIEPGTRLREWEIVRFVGRGSYGVVFEARRSSWLDEPPRALKIFDPIISSAARSALLGEFSTLTDVRHPHLLAGIDAFDLVEAPYAGCVVFVLELADEDLSHRVARTGALAPDEAAAVVADVADGLAALHAEGRIHGDVKPENILRVGDRWVLGDFGVTSVLEGSYAVTHAATIDYRPPEAAHAENGTRQHRSADVWALGVSLHVAATGRHPFPGPDPMMRYAAALRGERAVVTGLDPRLASIIDDGCLVADPHRRLPAAEVAARLRHLARGVAPPSPPSPPPPAPAPPAPPAPPVRSSMSAPPSPSPAPARSSVRSSMSAPPSASTSLPASDSPPAPPASVPQSAVGVDAAAAADDDANSSSSSSSSDPGWRPWLVLALVVVATVVLTQVVALACGAVLTGVAARRVAYLTVSAGLLVAAAVWFLRRMDGSGARPAPLLLAGCVATTWSIATVALFV